VSFEPRVSEWIRTAPLMDGLEDFIEELRAQRSRLALSIARVVELLGEALVDPGIALPALASACATLDDPRSSDKDQEVARFEIETLMPVPDRPTLLSPDVPVEALSRGPKPRT
jgi:hypothetical protein